MTEIMSADAAYGCALVRYLIEDLIRSVRETVAESPDEKAKKRILQIVAKAGRISKQKLTRKTQFIRRTFRDEYLDDLVQSGEIVVVPGDERGIVYRIGAGS